MTPFRFGATPVLHNDFNHLLVFGLDPAFTVVQVDCTLFSKVCIFRKTHGANGTKRCFRVAGACI